MTLPAAELSLEDLVDMVLGLTVEENSDAVAEVRTFIKTPGVAVKQFIVHGTFTEGVKGVITLWLRTRFTASPPPID